MCRGSILQSSTEANVEECLLQPGFLVANSDGPYHSGQDHLPSRKPPKTAGWLNRGQTHKKRCAYRAEEFGVYFTGKGIQSSIL